jgi:IMP cyclohydrolase
MDVQKDIFNNEKNLSGNIYPGRGIVMGMTPDADRYVQVYWIMGRSENSRNRIFSQDGDFVRTKPFDDAKVEDPSLIIYYPVRHTDAVHIVSNGDQTDTVFNAMKKNESAESALCTRTYEPDGPNFTPRITGIIDCSNRSFVFSILKKQNETESALRIFFRYEKLVPGIGYCIHTYFTDGNPLPSFRGEPYVVGIGDSDRETAEKFWSLLNKENRISLLVASFDLSGKDKKITIINRYS